RSPARRARTDAADGRHVSRDRLGRDPEAPEDRCPRPRCAGLRREPSPRTPGLGVDGGAGSRQHGRGDGRGRSPAGAADGAVGPAPARRAEGRKPRATHPARCMAGPVPPLEDARVPRGGRGSGRGRGRSTLGRRAARGGARSARRRGPAHPRGERGGGSSGRRHVSDPRCRLPLLAGRNHQAPRPDGGLAAGRRTAAFPGVVRRFVTALAVSVPPSEVCSGKPRSRRSGERQLFGRSGTARRAARMHEATTIPTLTSDTPENLIAAARRAESWFGEPFLAPDEDAAQALAHGTARRAALDDALTEIDSGLTSPSARWKVRYGLMLGLERVLTEDPP